MGNSGVGWRKVALDGKGIFVSDLCSDSLGFPPRPVSSEGALEVCPMSVGGTSKADCEGGLATSGWIPEEFLRWYRGSGFAAGSVF